MATISTVKLADFLVPGLTAGAMPFEIVVTGTATLADNGDNIEVFDLPAGYVLQACQFKVSATLGASCTSQLRIGTTAITGATTAGGADSELQTVVVSPSASEQSVNILIGGADISAAANFTLTGMIGRCSTVTVP